MNLKFWKNLPIFKGKDKTSYKNKNKGKINIKTRNKIFNIQKILNTLFHVIK